MSVFLQMCETMFCKSKMYKLEEKTKKTQKKSSYHLPINSENLDYVLLPRNLW